VLLETSLPDIDGYAVCRELRDLFGDVLPILFTTSSRLDTHDLIAGFLVGGDDYIVKPCDPGELLARVRRHLARTATLLIRTPLIRTHVIRTPAPVETETFALTGRELEILQRLANGCAPGQIARDLVISPKTVASHLQRTLSKMRVHSRIEAVALAYRHGLLDDPQLRAPA
jgi:DNA-binding NarL/FixJ family response regulator